MTKGRWLIGMLVIGCLAAGCRPRTVLSSQQMEDILVDLHRADGLISVVGMQYPRDSLQQICYGEVLEKHHITQAQFDSSLIWYTAHPQLFDKIYPRVMARLQAENDRLQMEIDALKKAKEIPLEKKDK